MVGLSALAREQRRVILVLTDADIRLGRTDPKLVDFFDGDEAAIIGIPAALRSDDPLIQQLSSQNRLQPGTLLVQSPYNPAQYEFADAAVTEFAVAKFMLLTRVCQRLGAKSVKVDKVNTRRRDEQVHTDSTVRAGVHSGGMEADINLSNNVRERLELEDTFPGGPSDIDGARQLLVSAGLFGDATLESLVEMRAGANALTRREIKLSLTQESSQNLHIAAHYSALSGVRVSTDFKRQVNENIDVVLQATITFPT